MFVVTLLHNVCVLYAQFPYLCYWHASQLFRICGITAFKACYFFHYFGWYFSYFVGMIWHSTVKCVSVCVGGGGGLIIQAIPPPKILGGISPIHSRGALNKLIVPPSYLWHYCPLTSLPLTLLPLTFSLRHFTSEIINSDILTCDILPVTLLPLTFLPLTLLPLILHLICLWHYYFWHV